MIEAPREETHVYLPGHGKRAREIGHPISPELLVAHLSGELPPAARLAVRDHLDTCDSCRGRSRALSGPYYALAALGSQHVSFVPDLRRPVRQRWAQGRLLARVRHTLGVMGGGSLAGIAAVLAIVLVFALFVITNTFQAPVILARSTNGAGAVSVVGGTGLLYAETSKVMDVTAADGTVWPAAEVIAINQRSAAVTLSLPQTGRNLRVGNASDLPLALALALAGGILYEITAPHQGRQALLAFDAHTGKLLFATTLTMPGGGALPAGAIARALAIAPDGSRVYLSVSASPGSASDPSLLVLDQRGSSVSAAYQPTLDPLVREPPPPGALPGVAATQYGPALNTVGLLRSSVSGGLSISADGHWIFDAIALSSTAAPVAVVVRRIDATTGTTTASVALPGDFSLSVMAASLNATSQLLYLAQVGSAGGVYVLDVSGNGLVAHSEIPLGGLSAPPHVTITGTVSVSPTVDGTHAYVGADTSSAGDQVSSHDIWLVDGVTNTVASHRIEFLDAGQPMANGLSGNQATVFVMRGGQIVLLPPDLALSTTPPVWLRLADGLPLLRLIATRVS